MDRPANIGGTVLIVNALRGSENASICLEGLVRVHLTTGKDLQFEKLDDYKHDSTVNAVGVIRKNASRSLPVVGLKWLYKLASLFLNHVLAAATSM